MQHFEISTNRNRLRDDRAVIEHKRGHSLQWIDRRIFPSLMLQFRDIDLFDWHRNTLFSLEDTYAPGVWHKLAVIELHAAFPIRYPFCPNASRTWSKTCVKGM